MFGKIVRGQRSLTLGAIAVVCWACTSTPNMGGGPASTGDTGETTVGDGTSLDAESGSTPDLPDPEGSLCSMLAQDCPPELKCMLRLGTDNGVTPHFECQPVVGAAGLGDACTSQGLLVGRDDCDADGVCVGGGPQLEPYEGICMPFCMGDPSAPSCADPDRECYDPATAVCLLGCDPLFPSCPEGFNCATRDAGNRFVCAPTEGTAGVGEDCGLVALSCAPGTTCRDAPTVPGCEGIWCCSDYCDLDAMGNGCAQAGAGAVCIALEGTTAEFAQVGVCGLPV